MKQTKFWKWLQQYYQVNEDNARKRFVSLPAVQQNGMIELFKERHAN